jgi:endonuclease-3
MQPYIVEIFERLKKNNPNPKTDLEFTNPYTLTVAVVLSAQTTDKGVNKITKDLFQFIHTPEDMINFGLEKLKESIKSIGFYNVKAKNVIELSKMLIDKYHSQIPNIRKDLESLPGVGRKSASVILNVAFGKHTMAVDTHVFRVSHRLNLSKEKDPIKVEHDLVSIIPDEYMNFAQHWLVLHGRYTCKAKKPLCESCCIQDICPFNKKNN